MGIKSNRAASFCIVAAIYAVAAVVGALVYNALPYDFWLKLLIADVCATVVTFIFSILFGNASVYDPYWSVQPMVILILFALKTRLTAAGALLIAVVCLWGVRLTANWVYTFHGLDCQDWRYTMLHDTTGAFYPLVNFFGIHMVPTLIVYGSTLPAVYVLRENGELNPGVVAGAALSLCAVTLQIIADTQMHRFRREGSGGLIRVGLWKHSRHPNYLGEILMWWGVAIASVSSLSFRWYLVAGAAANTILFLSASIPMADRRQSKKSGFTEYKKQTRMLLPIKRFR